jgi:hypothetical protein
LKYAAFQALSDKMQRMTNSAVNDKKGPRASAIFESMNLLPRYARLPVSPPLAALALLVLLLMLWIQGNTSALFQHLYLLIASYLTWGFLLPFIQGMVEGIHWKSRKTILVACMQMTGLILLHFVVSNILYYAIRLLLIPGEVLPGWAAIRGFLAPSLLSRLFDFVVFFGLLSWMYQSKSLTEKRVQLIQAETQLQKSKLDSLRSQLNPHFLFNTLHAITSMIGSDDDKAREITIKISTLLRKTLQANEKTLHTLGQELDLIQDYFDIEKERYGSRLKIDLEIDPETPGYVVPTMCLQPLVENAFKHGVAVVEGKTKLSLRVARVGKDVAITLCNDMGTADSAVPSNGIGLKNLKERLELSYQDRFTLEYGAQGQQFITKLTLPGS